MDPVKKENVSPPEIGVSTVVDSAALGFDNMLDANQIRLRKLKAIRYFVQRVCAREASTSSDDSLPVLAASHQRQQAAGRQGTLVCLAAPADLRCVLACFLQNQPSTSSGADDDATVRGHCRPPQVPRRRAAPKPCSHHCRVSALHARCAIAPCRRRGPSRCTKRPRRATPSACPPSSRPGRIRGTSRRGPTSRRSTLPLAAATPRAARS